MKKLLVLLVIFGLVLAGCEEENEIDNTDIIGTWYGSYGSGNTGLLTLSISGGEWNSSSDKWTVTFNDPNGTTASYWGEWERSGNTLSLANGYGTASLSGKTLTFHQRISTINSRPTVCELKRTLPPGANSTSLKIRNESSLTISDIIWQGTTFTGFRESIKPGANVNKNVEPGLGYLYFSVAYAGSLRTNSPVTVEKDEQVEFTITNNTVVVEVNNPTITKTLGEYIK